MAQHYSNPKRARDPHALPDVETFEAVEATCRDCGTTFPADAETPCPECGRVTLKRYDGLGWYWWACSPGCLPDGEPVGPFATEAEALADAREGIEDGEGD